MLFIKNEIKFEVLNRKNCQIFAVNSVGLSFKSGPGSGSYQAKSVGPDRVRSHNSTNF
jgi:hypothetical protein